MEVGRRLALVSRLRWLRKARAPVARTDAHVLHELPEIDAALRRVADGAYGICTVCAAPIAPERLELLPATPYCVDCAATDGPPTGKRHTTVPAGRVRGDQVRFVTDGELGDLLVAMLRSR